jgi:fatty acid desaturase
MTPVLYAGTAILAVQAWHAGTWWLLVACWLVMMHAGHMMLLAFHEAVHYHLSKKRWANELRGILLGTFALIPLSVYRHVHRLQHARLACPEDAELWPYNQPRIPRLVRIAAAAAELTLSFPFSQVLFFRGLLVGGRLPSTVRARIAVEYAALFAVWGAALALVAAHGWWQEFAVAYVVPALGAATLQAWRKFIEHVGLEGNSPTTATRCIIPRNAVGKAFSAMMLHENYHSTHHRYGSLHFHDLAAATPPVHAADPRAVRVFPSYFIAMLDMLPALADPRVGAQWPAART